MTPARLGGLLAMILALSWSGCDSTNDGGNNENGGANDNAAANDNVENENQNESPDQNDNSGDDGPLEAEQAKAVDDVVTLTYDLLEALGGMAEIANPDAFPPGDSATFGTCPVITTDSTDGSRVIVFDYGDGCSNELFGDAELSGSVGIVVEFDAGFIIEVDFNDFTIDTKTISGSISATWGRVSDETFFLEGTVDLETASGSVEGTLTVSFNFESGQILIAATEPAQLALTAADGTPYVITLDGLILDPVSNGNLVPEAGTITFEIPTQNGQSTVDIVITFTEDSPSELTVWVAVGPADPVEYSIADLLSGGD